MRVTSIATTVPGNPGSEQSEVNPQGLTYMPADGGAPASATDLILSVVALAILAPVLIFIGTATRLSAARREQRFAAMRLVGATRKQVSVLAATESTIAAILGVAVGFGIFFLLRTPVAGIPFIGTPFFPATCALSLFDVLVVAIGVPLAAAAAARLALRRVHISPLGVARRATPKPPASGGWCRCWPASPSSASGPCTATRPRSADRSRRSCPASRSSSSACSSRDRGSPWPRRRSWPGGPAAPAR